MPDAEIQIDTSGLYYPIPILRLEKALRGDKEGAVIRPMATDPPSVADVQVSRPGGTGANCSLPSAEPACASSV